LSNGEAEIRQPGLKNPIRTIIRRLGAPAKLLRREFLFDHVKFGASDYAASKAFFLKALEPLGVRVAAEGVPTYGVELVGKTSASLIVYQSADKPAPLHLAFVADNRAQVDAFYHAALAAGAKDNGPPGLRPQYHATYYAAFVIGPDGHNVEAVCHASQV
jgi:catechol 2,3-dioxygenase-like lactoylglutathione lyase family enzyme